MSFDMLLSPVKFLKKMLGAVPCEETLQAYEAYWEKEGKRISEATDRAGTPWLRMFDPFGERTDAVLFPPEYWKMLHRGYQAGVVWQAFEEKSLLSSYLLGYVTAFYDPGLYCPYTVSLSTAVPLEKYGAEELKARFLSPMLRRDETVWQGATWGRHEGRSPQREDVLADLCQVLRAKYSRLHSSGAYGTAFALGARKAYIS